MKMSMCPACKGWGFNPDPYPFVKKWQVKRGKKVPLRRHEDKTPPCVCPTCHGKGRIPLVQFPRAVFETKVPVSPVLEPWEIRAIEASKVQSESLKMGKAWDRRIRGR